MVEEVPMIGNIFIGLLAIAALVIAYMCGVSDGCKTNACFRGGKDVK